MTADAWMTYAEAAVELGLSVESVRQRARREVWRKQLGNDGRARIMIPPDTARSPGGEDEADTPDHRPRHRPESGPAATALLQAQIAILEARGAELRADLERERCERVEERIRGERLVSEVADLARQLARVTEEAAERERGLRDRISVAETKPRRWWQRRAS